MLAKEIGQVLQDRQFGNLGGSVFIGEFPKENEDGNAIQSGIYIVNASGQGQDKYVDVFYEDVDFWSLNPSYESAYDLLDNIRKALSRLANYETPNYYIFFSHDMTGIMDMDRTRDGIKIYKITLRFIYRDKRVIS